MRRGGRFLAGFLVALCLTALPGGAQSAYPGSSADGLPPGDEQEEVLLGVAAFRFSGDQGAHSYLGDNLARLLGEMVGEIPSHFVDDREREALAAAAVAGYRRRLLKNLDELQTRRDALLFSGPDSRRDVPGRASLDKNIAETRERLELLDRLPREDIPVQRERRLKVSRGSGEGDMLLPPVTNPAGAAQKAGVDYLIYGEVELQGEDFFTATAFFYGARSELLLGTARAAGSGAESHQAAEELFRGLAEAVVGRPWAVLAVEVEPEEAEIFWEDSLVGIGRARLAYVPPGTYRIRAQARGFESREQTVELPSRGTEEISLSLPPIDGGSLTMGSLPGGAEVYLGAQRLGSTPLEIPLTPGLQILRLEAEGHKSRALVFPPAAEDQGLQILPRDIFAWKDRIETSRRSFYRAFGWFVMSIPLPLLLNGLYQNSAFAYMQYSAGPSPDYDSLRGMAEKADFLYYSYFGSLFISGSLLVNAVQKLFDYIRIGEEAQRYPERWRRD